MASNRIRKDFITGCVLRMVGYEQCCLDNTFVSTQEREIAIGVYWIIMKGDSDNFCQSAILGVIKRIAEKGIYIVEYESILADDEIIWGSKVFNELNAFKKSCDAIIANRYAK